MSFCIKCGQELKDEKSCPSCGTAVEEIVAETVVTPVAEQAAATETKKGKFSFKKILPWIIAGAIILSIGSCFGGDDGSGDVNDGGGGDLGSGGSTVVDSNGFEKDTWYVYKPAPNLYFQNAKVSQATYLNDDKTRMRVYCFPYCVACEETLELRSFILSAQYNNSMEEDYTCDSCGGTVTLRAEWSYD